jgi:hypothetical protein
LKSLTQLTSDFWKNAIASAINFSVELHFVVTISAFWSTFLTTFLINFLDAAALRSFPDTFEALFGLVTILFNLINPFLEVLMTFWWVSLI